MKYINKLLAELRQKDIEIKPCTSDDLELLKKKKQIITNYQRLIWNSCKLWGEELMADFWLVYIVL